MLTKEEIIDSVMRNNQDDKVEDDSSVMKSHSGLEALKAAMIFKHIFVVSRENHTSFLPCSKKFEMRFQVI